MNNDPVKIKVGNFFELAILCLMIFFLPLAEAPKNIFFGLYVLVWMIRRVTMQTCGGKWNYWDSLFLIWISVGFLSVQFAGLPGAEWASALDPLRYILLGWLISRSGYRKNELIIFPIVLIFSLVLTLAVGYWELLVSHKTDYLQLHSVGHVNHSAVYVAISLGVSIALIPWVREKYRSHFLYPCFLLTVFFISFSLLVTSSRGAIGAMMVVIPTFILLQPLITFRAKIRFISIWLGVVVVAFSGYVTLQHYSTERITAMGVIGKFEQDKNNKEIFSFRDRLWATSLVAVEKYPLFGVGISNFKNISLEKVCAWKLEAELAGKCLTEKYYFSSHAHSLFFTVLAEEGGYGITVLLIVLCSFVISLVRCRHKIMQNKIYSVIWGASVCAIGVAIVAGILNTTIHHENALLLMVFLGSWLSIRR